MNTKMDTKIDTKMDNQTLSKALEEMGKLSREARVEAVRTSPFGEELFMGYYMPHFIKTPFAPFHFEMFQDWRDLRAGRIRELVWVMFRGSAKTSISKSLFTKMICFNERNYMNVDCLDKKNADNFLFDVSSELLSNRRILNDFGYLFKKKRSTEEMTMSRLGDSLVGKNSEMKMEAHSIAENVRGRLFSSFRPDFLLLDDFETNKTKDSEAYTSVTRGHIDEFSTGLANDAKILYLCNYITKTGAVQYLMDRAEKDPMMRIRVVPIEDEDGNPTWPERFCKTKAEVKTPEMKSLEEIKSQFDFVLYQTEMMNNPIGSEQQIFKKEMFKYISYDEVMRLNCRVFMTIDTAVSQKTSADYTGICINFVDREGYWNLMTFKRRMTPKELLDFIFEYWEKYKIEEIGIEKTTFQMALKEFFEEEMRKRGKFPRIVDLLHRGQRKEERIRGALLGRYETGSIRHISNYVQGLEEEALAFPGSKNDDVIDACFHGDTQVLSEFGYKKIKDIVAGDKVITPMGLQRVVWSGKTGVKRVICKNDLVATPDHKIFNGESFDKLDSIEYYNHINRFNLLNQLVWKYKKLLFSMESPTLSWEGKESIILVWQKQIMEGKILKDFTWRFGNFITKQQYLKATVFTIKTAIALITTLKIWSVFLAASTCQLMVKKDLKLINNGRWNFIKKALKLLQTGENLAKTTKKEVVSIADANLQPISTVKIDSAIEVAVPVFNITVENDNCYYANGILVANCSYQDQIAKSPFSEVKLLVQSSKPQYCG